MADSTLNKVVEIVVDKLGVDESKVTKEAKFIDDLGADSLDTVELIMEFEDEFGLEIPDEDAEKILSVSQAVDYIENNKQKLTNKVVITGIGVISPIGNELQTFTDSLRSGINGVGDISLFDTSDFNVNIAAESSVKLEDFFDKKELNRLDRFTAFSLIASRQAVKQAKLINPKDDNNIGVIPKPP